MVATDALIAVAETAEVFLAPRATRLSLDREGLRRLAADELGLPTALFWFAGSAKELAAVAEHAGFPAGGRRRWPAPAAKAGRCCCASRMSNLPGTGPSRRATSPPPTG